MRTSSIERKSKEMFVNNQHTNIKIEENTSSEREGMRGQPHVVETMQK